MTRQLKLYDDYSRYEVHDIFDPDASFTRGAGLWGMQGIIPIAGRPKDFVLFVSYGRSQGEHEFDEGISGDGILRWQSQPKQTFEDLQIRQFIAHDETVNSIHLFLRTRIRENGEQLPYTYLGRLKYLGHDAEARRAIEDHGFAVHDANILFRANCPNIDIVVFGKTKAFYIQVKSSEKPASKDSVVIDGSPWTEAQLREGAPIFNKHCDEGHYDASLIFILDRTQDGNTNFYIVPPKKLEELVRATAMTFADKPKRDGSPRSIKFRKELSRDTLKSWRDAWHLLE